MSTYETIPELSWLQVLGKGPKTNMLLGSLSNVYFFKINMLYNIACVMEIICYKVSYSNSTLKSVQSSMYKAPSVQLTEWANPLMCSNR